MELLRRVVQLDFGKEEAEGQSAQALWCGVPLSRARLARGWRGPCHEAPHFVPTAWCAPSSSSLFSFSYDCWKQF